MQENSELLEAKQRKKGISEPDRLSGHQDSMNQLQNSRLLKTAKGSRKFYIDDQKALSDAETCLIRDQ
jgi:hypothetical protein